MPSSTARIHSLDAMRGLLAIGVMLYHVLGWSDTVRVLTLGTYGVYAFFVLSGFALEWAYADRLRSPDGVRRYAAARLGRILPLYGLATIAVATLAILGGHEVDASNVALNLSLTFGFFDPGSTSTVTGGWSIGIEVVFYLLFPAIAWLRLSTPWLTVLAMAMLGLRVVFLESFWQADDQLSDVWVEYTRVPGFLWFFVAGMVGARLVAARDGRPAAPARPPWLASAGPIATGAVIVLLVVAASSVGDQRAMFMGPLGLALSGGVAVAVVVVGHAPPWRGRAARIAESLGDMSYGTYLLHPLVWTVVGRVGFKGMAVVLITVIAAPLLALLVHRAIELPAGRAIRTTLAPRRPPAPVPVTSA